MMTDLRHTALRDLLDEDSPPPSLDELRLLYFWFNSECLKYTTEEQPVEDKVLSQEKLVSSALRLSKSLQNGISPTWPVYLETQLRTLVATFALLHLKKVVAIRWDAHQTIKNRGIDQLYSEITAFNKDRDCGARNIEFSEILYRDGDPQTATNVYLVQLAMQYFSIFRCFADRKYETTNHALDAVFGSLSLPGGQYGQIRQVIEGISGIANVWWKRKPELHPICMLQEHIRRVTGLLSAHSHLNQVDDCGVHQMLARMLDQTEEIFDKEYPQHSTASETWHTARTVFRLGPPKINSRYYFYGLLDCIAQLTAFLDLEAARPSLYRKLKDIALDEDVVESRWKALECLLSCSKTRVKVQSSLLSDMPSSQGGESQKDAVRKEIRFISLMLKKHERNGAKRISCDPLSCRLTSIPENGTKYLTPQSSRTNSVAQWPEQHRVMRLERGNRKFNDLTTYVAGIDPKGERSPNCDVTLSSDCQRACFYTDKDLLVFGLKRPSNQPILPEGGTTFFPYDNEKAGDIRLVAMTRGHLISISEHRGGHLVNVRSFTARAPPLRSVWQRGNAKALQVHETTSALHILLSVSVVSKGCVLYYRIPLSDSTRRSIGTPADILEWDDPKSHLKHLHLHTRSGTLAAVTHDNIIYLWRNLLDQISELREDLSSLQKRGPDWWYKPPAILPGSAIQKDRGITSVSLFQPSPASSCSSISVISASECPLYLFYTFYPPRGEEALSSLVFIDGDKPETHHINSLSTLPRTLTASCVSEDGNLLAILHHPNSDFPAWHDCAMTKQIGRRKKRHLWSLSKEPATAKVATKKEARHVRIWGIDKPPTNDFSATSISRILDKSHAGVVTPGPSSPPSSGERDDDDDEEPPPDWMVLKGADRGHPAQPTAVRFENEYQIASTGQKELSRVWLWAADATGKVFAQAYVPSQ